MSKQMPSFVKQLYYEIKYSLVYIASSKIAFGILVQPYIE